MTGTRHTLVAVLAITATAFGMTARPHRRRALAPAPLGPPSATWSPTSSARSSVGRSRWTCFPTLTRASARAP
jgi:hypothetical protein